MHQLVRDSAEARAQEHYNVQLSDYSQVARKYSGSRPVDANSPSRQALVGSCLNCGQIAEESHPARRAQSHRQYHLLDSLTP